MSGLTLQKSVSQYISPIAICSIVNVLKTGLKIENHWPIFLKNQYSFHNNGNNPKYTHAKYELQWNTFLACYTTFSFNSFNFWKLRCLSNLNLIKYTTEMLWHSLHCCRTNEKLIKKGFFQNLSFSPIRNYNITTKL